MGCSPQKTVSWDTEKAGVNRNCQKSSLS